MAIREHLTALPNALHQMLATRDITENDYDILLQLEQWVMKFLREFLLEWVDLRGIVEHKRRWWWVYRRMWWKQCQQNVCTNEVDCCSRANNAAYVYGRIRSANGFDAWPVGTSSTSIVSVRKAMISNFRLVLFSFSLQTDGCYTVTRPAPSMVNWSGVSRWTRSSEKWNGNHSSCWEIVELSVVVPFQFCSYGWSTDFQTNCSVRFVVTLCEHGLIDHSVSNSFDAYSHQCWSPTTSSTTSHACPTATVDCNDRSSSRSSILIASRNQCSWSPSYSKWLRSRGERWTNASRFSVVFTLIGARWRSSTCQSGIPRRLDNALGGCCRTSTSQSSSIACEVESVIS